DVGLLELAQDPLELRAPRALETVELAELQSEHHELPVNGGKLGVRGNRRMRLRHAGSGLHLGGRTIAHRGSPSALLASPLARVRSIGPAAQTLLTRRAATCPHCAAESRPPCGGRQPRRSTLRGARRARISTRRGTAAQDRTREGSSL